MFARSLIFRPAGSALRRSSTISASNGNVKVHIPNLVVYLKQGLGFFLDFRAKLMTEIKAAMKAKNSTASTVFRSALSEINNVDKSAKEPLSSSAMIGIVRKGVQRRHEAAVKFKEANRDDLAEKEENEADLLNSILPPLLTVEQIDEHLKAVLTSLPAGSLQRSTGIIFKEFYARVDQGTVTGDLIKQRIKVVTGAGA